MSSSKKKGSKSSRKPSSNIDNTPPPNTSFNQDPNAYHPMMFSSAPDSPMFSPSQNQYLQNLVYNLSQHQNPFPTQGQNALTTPSPPQADTQTSETQIFSRQPRRLLASDTEEEEEEEEEEAEDEEAEEEQLQRRQQQQRPSKGRRRGKAPAVQRSKGAPWNVDEVIALARTWVDISEDATEGNDQDITAFQIKIWKLWCKRMGREYRTHQSIYSKWRNVSKIAKDFESIYGQLKRNWQSGANIDDVMVDARQQYVDTYGTKQPFNLQAESFWRVIRDNQKWKNQTTFHQFALHSSKRSKTSASTHSASSDANIGSDMNENTQDDVLPMGRDQAKRKMRGGSSGTNTSSQASVEVTQMNEELATLHTMTEDKVRAKLMDVVTRNISDLRGFEYQIALEGKKMAAKRLGITFDDDE